MTTTTAILLKHLTVKSKSGFEWLCLCPYHEDNSPSFSVNIRKRLFICYACGAKGNMTQLLEHLGVVEKLDEEEISLDELSAKIKGVGEDVSRTVRPPVGIPVSPTIYSNQIAIDDYWHTKRRLDKSAISAYKLGFDVLNDEAIIPVCDFNGHNIGIIRRTFDPSRPRYLYSKGMKTSEVVFGAYEAMRLAEKNKGMKGVLVITEGSVDAMTAYDIRYDQVFFVGVAILGSRMSRQQAQIIRKMGFEDIIIATDMDRAGKTAQLQAETMLKENKAGAFIHKAEWSEELGKDLNSLPMFQVKTILLETFLKTPVTKSNLLNGQDPYAKFIKKTTTTTTLNNHMVRVNVNGSWHYWSYGMFGTVPSHEMIEVTNFGDECRSFIWEKAPYS